jgi:hypothetical protein
MRTRTFTDGTVLSREDMKKIQGGLEPVDSLWQCTPSTGGTATICSQSNPDGRCGYDLCVKLGGCGDPSTVCAG